MCNLTMASTIASCRKHGFTFVRSSEFHPRRQLMVRRAHCPAFAPGLLASWAEPIVNLFAISSRRALVALKNYKPAFQMELSSRNVFLVVQIIVWRAGSHARSWPPSHRRARCRPHTAYEVVVALYPKADK
jgi:hypothetical protein